MIPNRNLLKPAVGLAAASLLAACATSLDKVVLETQAGGTNFKVAAAGPSNLPGAGQAETRMLDDHSGALMVSVKWPLAARNTQAIPLSTSRVDLTLTNQAATVIATGSIVNPATSSVLTRLAAGTYTLAASARRANDTVVADGSASATVVANRVGTTSLTLNPKFVPALSYIYPNTGDANTTISIYGSNLDPGVGGSVQVLVDGQAVNAGMVQAGNPITLIGLPIWASSNASISVVVDGIPSTRGSTQVFTKQAPIDHLVITPSSKVMTTSATQSFVAYAYSNVAGTATVSTQIFWSILSQSPVSSQSTVFSLDYGLFRTYVTSGSAVIQASAGGKSATASVTVNLNPGVL